MRYAGKRSGKGSCPAKAIQKLLFILTLASCLAAAKPCTSQENKPIQSETVTESFWPEVMDSLNTRSIASQETNPDRTILHLIIVRSFRNCSEYTLTQEPKCAHISYIEWSRKRTGGKGPFPIVKNVSSTADTTKASEIFNNLTELGFWTEPENDERASEVDDGDVWLIEINDGNRFKKLDRSQGRGFKSIEPLLMSLAGIEVPRTTTLARPHKGGLDLDFIKQVGGIKVGPIRRKPDGTAELALNFNISGRETISVAPTSLNSMFVVKNIWMKRSDNEIHISLIPTHPHSNYSSSRPKFINLGTIPDGNYKIVYDSPQSFSDLGTMPLGAP